MKIRIADLKRAIDSRQKGHFEKLTEENRRMLTEASWPTYTLGEFPKEEEENGSNENSETSQEV